MSSSSSFRAIRALYDEDCITVYQAYSNDVAEAAVREQKLYASSSFRFDRMTWVKPSWCWMMYRSGYSHKDEGQARILAIRITHEDFKTILRQARLTHRPRTKGGQAGVLVQWDPERSHKIGRLEHRSIQIGICPQLTKSYVNEWIESIEDVTQKARELKDQIQRYPKTSAHELVELGLMPHERLYEVPEDVRERLEMS